MLYLLLFNSENRDYKRRGAGHEIEVFIVNHVLLVHVRPSHYRGLLVRVHNTHVVRNNATMEIVLLWEQC